jgi:hypothetical protein
VEVRPNEGSAISALPAFASWVSSVPRLAVPLSSLPSFDRAGSSSAYTWYGRPVSDWKRTSTSSVLRAGSVT